MLPRHLYAEVDTGRKVEAEALKAPSHFKQELFVLVRRRLRP